MTTQRIPFHLDPQNVHRVEVAKIHTPILEWLLRTSNNLMGLEETLSRIHSGVLRAIKNRTRVRSWRAWFESFFNLPDQRVVALMENLRRSVDCKDPLYTTTAGLTYNFADILRLVVTKVYETQDPELAKRLLLELCDGMGVCVGGQAARLLNTFCGFEMAPQVDPRSVFERVGDEMSVLARNLTLSTEERVAAGREILERNGLSEQHRAPWLEALVA